MSTASSEGGIESRLFVVRESGRDFGALRSLLHRTLKLEQLPNLTADYLASAIDQIHTPTPESRSVATGADRGVVVSEGTDAVLLYQGSANMKSAALGEDAAREDNRFVAVLKQELARCKPSRVVVTEVSRLARRTDLFDQVLDSLVASSSDARVGRRTYDPRVSSERDELKRMALDAESERNLTVDRTTAGALIKADLGQWPMAENLLPLGFRLDENGYPIVDPDEVELVAAVIDLLGEPNLTSSEFTRKCGRLGVPAPGVSVRGGRRVRSRASVPTVDKASNPSEVVRRLLKALEVWSSGEFFYVRRCSSSYTHEIAGFEVTWDPQKGRSFRIPIPMPKPEGGWADDAAMKKALARPPSTRGQLSHAQQKSMFSQLPGWIEDQTAWTILLKGDRHIVKSRRALCHELEGGSLDKIDGGPSQHRFSVHRDELLQSIVAGIASGLEAGVEGVVKEGVDLASATHRSDTRRHLEYRNLKSQVARLHTKVEDGFRLVARLDEDSYSLTAAKKRLEAWARDLESAEEQVRRFDDIETTKSGLLLESTDLDLALVARALAVLRSCTGLVDRRVATHVARLFADFRLRQTGPAQARWECWLRVPTAEGVAELGPFEGAVRVCGTARSPHGELAASVLRAFMCEGQSLEQVGSVLGVKPQSTLARVKAILREAGFVEGMLSPIALGMPPVVRSALAFAVGFEKDEGFDQAWIDLLRRAYLVDVGQRWNKGWWTPLDERQAVLDHVAANGGVTRVSEVPARPSLLNRWAIDGEIPATHAIARRTRRQCDAVLMLKTCRHCNSQLDQVIRVPELVVGFDPGASLVCAICRRADVEPSPILPDCYLRVRACDAT